MHKSQCCFYIQPPARWRLSRHVQVGRQCGKARGSDIPSRPLSSQRQDLQPGLGRAACAGCLAVPAVGGLLRAGLLLPGSLAPRGHWACLGTSVIIRTRGAPAINEWGSGVLRSVPQCPGRPHRVIGSRACSAKGGNIALGEAERGSGFVQF